MSEVHVSDDADFVRSQYRTEDNLAVRIRTHERFSENKVDFTAWILDAIKWRGDETVVDVGCGAGVYVSGARRRAGRYIASDLSAGMLRRLEQSGVPRLKLDAQDLPLRRASVDVVLANHMLYHVPDIERAIAEFRRVLRPGGRLLAATNSANNMAELSALSSEVADQLNLPLSPTISPNLTFTLENGASYLIAQFQHVERRDLPGALVFSEAQPVIDYIASTYERYERFLPDHVSWRDVAEALRSNLQRKVERHGEFRVKKLTGVFVCWNL